jgi:hypothetical protein
MVFMYIMYRTLHIRVHTVKEKKIALPKRESRSVVEKATTQACAPLKKRNHYHGYS